MELNLAHLRVLSAIGAMESVSGAARQLGITQSGASQTLAAAEACLGASLVVRSRSGAHLTELGDRIVRRARVILDELEAIHGEVDAMRGLLRGRVRIGSVSSVFANVLPPCLQRFRQRHPGIQVSLLEGADHEVDAWLAKGAIDLGIVMNPEPARDIVVFGRDPWVAVAPARHRFARRQKPVSLAELSKEPFVLITLGCTGHAGALAAQHGVRLDVRVEVRELASGLAMVREGLGVAVVPQLTLAREELPGMAVLPLQEQLTRTFGLAMAEGATSSPVARLVREELGPMLESLEAPHRERKKAGRPSGRAPEKTKKRTKPS